MQPTYILLYRLMRVKETAEAHQAFKYLLRAGDDSSISSLGKNLTSTGKYLYIWAERFRWDERVDVAHHAAMERFNSAAHRANERVAAVMGRLRGEVAAHSPKMANALNGKLWR